MQSRLTTCGCLAIATHFDPAHSRVAAPFDRVSIPGSSLIEYRLPTPTRLRRRKRTRQTSRSAWYETTSMHFSAISRTKLFALAVVCTAAVSLTKAQNTDGTPPPAPLSQPGILTPPSPSKPLIHGPKIFGVRPGSLFLYTIPATGDRPMTFSAQGAAGWLKAG